MGHWVHQRVVTHTTLVVFHIGKYIENNYDLRQLRRISEEKVAF